LNSTGDFYPFLKKFKLGDGSGNFVSELNAPPDALKNVQNCF
jgi:hypothetical protein